MSPFSQAIADRASSEQFPLSIATGLAIEAAVGVHPDYPVKVAPILHYDQLWINVRTLFRNLYGALEPEVAKAVMPVHFAEVLIEEMDVISGIIADFSNNRTKVIFYLSNYNGLEQKYRHAKIRMDNTDKQKAYRSTVNATLANLLQMVPDRITGYELKIGGTLSQNATALILTNYAYDLLSMRSFKELTLLESHTGKIKGRALWASKYHNGKELANMPFREDLIQIFGDSETFAPQDIKLRKSLIEVAALRKWSATTTTDKIRDSLKDIPNQFAAELIRTYLVNT